MVRGPGKFKTKRGGGRSFSRDMVLDNDGIAGPRSSRRKTDSDDDDDDDDDDALKEEDEEEEEEDEEEVGPSASAEPELTRTERRELKRKQAAEKLAQKQDIDEEDEDLINPNHVEKKLTISDLGSRQLTRKEREVKEKQEAEDRYWKLHLAGKTDKAKADLARLKKIKEEREAAQAKRQAEAEAKVAEVEAKKKTMNEKRI